MSWKVMIGGRERREPVRRYVLFPAARLEEVTSLLEYAVEAVRQEREMPTGTVEAVVFIVNNDDAAAFEGTALMIDSPVELFDPEGFWT